MSLLVLLLAVVAARRLQGLVGSAALPAILLELTVGFLLGNTVLSHERLNGVAGIAELGVISLFFLVGLETRGDLLAKHRSTIVRTVLISSLAPLLFFVPLKALTGASTAQALLFLAVVAATGTGVTLRTLRSLGAMATPSARLLVGVSVLDDLPAVGLLALATFLARGSDVGGNGAGALEAGGPFASGGLGWIAIGLALAVLSYGLVKAWVQRCGPRKLGPLALVLMMISSAAAGEAFGLTGLFGALVGGMLLARLSPPDAAVEDNLVVFSDVFVPLYFVTVGMRVKLDSLLTPAAWKLAGLLTVMALISKLVCWYGIGKGARTQGVDAWTVVFGLIPRGLPGLVFAGGALKAGLIDDTAFSALVIMVTTTTVLGLLLLNRRVQSLRRKASP
ncbi:cation:proton antiporter [Cyanobium sp. Morenito 9A2]|uniref:cation:proton antiporter n=1 Tax=Cyanobium sp. Morenito 9A2 TaxID=2823718 RepID=UPI0020CB97B7|nr:cation:proton antiporter [Cyanobium sp. Morenito 9A2]MCP9849283.1 cation:proton antiporter [Cyanobium sp. Morenito 9A2]